MKKKSLTETHQTLVKIATKKQSWANTLVTVKGFMSVLFNIIPTKHKLDSIQTINTSGDILHKSPETARAVTYPVPYIVESVVLLW